MNLQPLSLKLLVASGTLSATLGAQAFFPIEIRNQSGIADKHTWLVIKAQNPAGEDCLMVFDQHGQGSCRPASGHFTAFDAAKRLATLPHKNGRPHLLLPKVASGRVYFSYKRPVDLPLDYQSGKLIDPDGFKPRDSNYYLLYDKVEFTYNDYGTWMNPTAVDFFSLPIGITQSGASAYQRTGLALSRPAILSSIKEDFAQDNPATASLWQKLLLTHSKPDGEDILLRVMSPGKAMQDDVPDTTPFDAGIFTDTRQYGHHGQSYIDTIWNHYRTHTLKVNISEITSNQQRSLCRGRVNANNTFIFQCDNGESVNLPKPVTSLPFFAGATGNFDARNNTAKAVVVRELTSATVVGLLPAKSSAVLSRNYFEQHHGEYYQRNTPNAQRYDLYGKALHSFGPDNPIYTYAYDDALAQDGTLHDPGQPGKAVITLYDIGKNYRQLPSVFEQDHKPYTIHPVIPRNRAGQPVIQVFKADCETDCRLLNGKTYVVQSPLALDIVSAQSGEHYKTIQLYLNKGVVRPYVKGSEGILLTQEHPNGPITLTFPAGLPEGALRAHGTTPQDPSLTSPSDSGADNRDQEHETRPPEAGDDNVADSGASQDNPEDSGSTTPPQNSQPADQFAGSITLVQQNGELTLKVTSNRSRTYAIVHYTSLNGIPQNRRLKGHGKHFSGVLPQVDTAKGFKLTLQDNRIGQFTTPHQAFPAIQGPGDEKADDAPSAPAEGHDRTQPDADDNTSHIVTPDGRAVENTRGRFTLKAQKQQDGSLTLYLQTGKSRSYAIMHYINRSGVKQNVPMQGNASGFVHKLTDMDRTQPFRFTLQDNQVGQFTTDEYQLSGAAEQGDEAPAPDKPDHSRPEPSSGVLQDPQGRFTGEATTNEQGKLELRITTSPSRAYVIVHYQDQHGRPMNVSMPKQAGGFAAVLADIDVTQPVHFTMADAETGQFETRHYRLKP